MRFKADATLFIVSIIWGTAFVSQRVAGQMGAVYAFNGVRYILAGVVVLPFAWRAEQKRRGTDKISGNQFKWMLVAGFLLFIASVLQQAGILYTTAANAGFLTAVYVVLVPIVLLVGWREKPHWLSLVAVVLATLGAYLLSTAGQFKVHAGDALELVGALFWSVHVVLLGKFASRFESMSFSVGQLLVCGLLNLGVGIFVQEPAWNWSLVGAAVYTAVFSLGLCYTLQVWAQRHTPPTDAALILSLESVFAAISGWLLLDELLLPIQLIGCAIILLAVILAQAKEVRFRVK